MKIEVNKHDETVDKAEAEDVFNDEQLVDAIADAEAEANGEPIEEDDDEEVPVEVDDVLDDEPAVGVDRGDGRDAKGQFASKAEQDAADKATADAKAAGKSPADQAAAATKAASDAKAAAPAPAAKPEPAKWEPYQIKADRALLPIEEAKISRVKDAAGNGHVLVAVAEKDFQKFSHRIARGVAAERKWREIEQTRQELEFEKSAPRPRSDNEIEAAIVMEAVMPNLGKLFIENAEGEMVPFIDPRGMENLTLKVKLAQQEEKSSFAAKEAERRAEQAAGTEWQQQQVEQIIDDAFEIVAEMEDLKGMKPEAIKELLADIKPIYDKLAWKENGQIYSNTELLYKLLKRAHSTAAPQAQSAAPAQPDTPAPAQPKAPDAGERFNKAQDTAAEPKSTSLKNGRTNRPLPERRPSRELVHASQQRDAKQVAEDEYIAEKRRQLRSDSFDDD